MIELKPNLIAEDSPKDAELILEALSDYNPANRVIFVRDGVEAMEYLRYEGKYTKPDELPYPSHEAQATSPATTVQIVCGRS